MRIVLLFLFILSLFPHPGLSTTLCISDGAVALEGVHLSQPCSDGCDMAKHHNHCTCTDIQQTPIGTSSRSDIVQHIAGVSHNSFDSIFASTPFRAPPVSFGKPHDLPSRIGLKLKSTTVILC